MLFVIKSEGKEGFSNYHGDNYAQAEAKRKEVGK